MANGEVNNKKRGILYPRFFIRVILYEVVLFGW